MAKKRGTREGQIKQKSIFPISFQKKKIEKIKK